MKKFQIIIRWRTYRWTLNGLARSSADLLCGMVEYLPFGALVVVKAMPAPAPDYAEYMIRRDQRERLTGSPRDI